MKWASLWGAVRTRFVALARDAGVAKTPVYAVRISAESSRLDDQRCAECDAGATHFTKLSHRSQGQEKHELVVPLCEACHRVLEGQRTRALGVGLSSALLGTTVALTLPLVWTAGAVPELFASSLGLSLVPFALELGWRAFETTGKKHGLGVRGVGQEWATVRAEFAARLAEGSPEMVVEKRLRWAPWPRWTFVALLPALVAGVAVQSQRPIVRLLNVSGEPLLIQVDGREIARLEPTGSESPNAGAAVRVAVGERAFRATDLAGARVDETVASIQSGQQHLYVPRGDDYCFWLERRSYGRESDAEADQIEHKPGGSFWLLPHRVDTWFGENPPRIQQDSRSSGGVLTALRQARCEDRARREGR